MWSSRLNGRIAVVPVVTGKLTLECKIWLITGKTMSHVRRLQRNETWSTTSAGSQSNKLATETVCSPCYLRRTNANTYNYLMTQPTLLVNNAFGTFLSVGIGDTGDKIPFLIDSGSASAPVRETDSCGMFYLWNSCLDLPFPSVISQHVKEQTKHKWYSRYRQRKC